LQMYPVDIISCNKKTAWKCEENQSTIVVQSSRLHSRKLPTEWDYLSRTHKISEGTIFSSLHRIDKHPSMHTCISCLPPSDLNPYLLSRRLEQMQSFCSKQTQTYKGDKSLTTNSWLNSRNKREMSSRVCPKDELNRQPSGFGMILSDDLVKRCLTMDLGLTPYARRGEVY